MKRFVAMLTVFLPVSVLYLAGGLEFFERRWMDAQFRFTERPVKSDVVLVDIDPKSLTALDVWPWPRGYHATVLENLLAAQARRVGFDIDFSARRDEQDDAEFAHALAASKGRVVLPVFQQWQHEWPDGYRLTAVEPLPEYRRHAILGTINVQPEADGLVRRYPNRGQLLDRLVPAFSSALAGDPRPELNSFYLDYSISVRTIPRLSYVDVLTGNFDPSLVEGRVVIVGPTAVELKDSIAVPVSGAMPGPLLQALAYESLTQDRSLSRQGPTISLLLALILILGLAPVIEVASWRRGLLITVATGGILLVALVALQRYAPILIDATPMVLTLIAIYGFSLVRRIDQQHVGLLAQGQAMRRTESLMRNVVENSFDAVVTISADGLVETFNRAAQRLFDYPESEARDLPLTILVQRSGKNAGRSFFAEATETPLEALGRRRDGRNFPVELVLTAIDTDDDPKIVAVIRDITERKAHQDELKHQATHDPLTDLPNRFLLHDRVETALKAAPEGTHAAILVLDLDRFKEINDVLGHHTGDLLLQQVARRLELPLQPSETIARLGGDEFAVLLPVTDRDEARRLGWKLIDELRNPFHVEKLTFQIDTSIGVAMFPEDGNDADALIQKADVAMYAAKRQRGGLAFYKPEQDFNSIRHLMLRGDLRFAIEDDLLQLAYQPKLSADGDAVVGVEALLRWCHPEHGNIPPDEFIALAEHSGLIRPLTQWVIRTAFRQGAAWRERGLDLRLSLNLSARNLMEEDLPQSVGEMLAEFGMAPHYVIFEITESVFMEDPERALKVVTRLREMGVRISIDDFGTGYSSLAYLMRLPAQELKIDRSFVMQMERDPGSATIVHSTIDLAHNLGLQVVAEGVESGDTWNVLKELGCDLGQGYYFSRPQPPDELVKWIEARTGQVITPLASIAAEPMLVGQRAGSD